MERRGGWYAKDASKAKTAVADDVLELWLYSTHASWSLHMDWLEKATQQRTASSSWFALSTWLLVWGWKSEDNLIWPPSSEQNSFHNWKVNCRPLSETMSWGTPCSQKRCWVSCLAVPKAVGNPGNATKWAALEDQSIIVRMVVLPTWPLVPLPPGGVHCTLWWCVVTSFHGVPLSSPVAISHGLEVHRWLVSSVRF